MDNHLRELREQRELIRKHLQWLDERIGELENQEPEKADPAKASACPEAGEQRSDETNAQAPLGEESASGEVSDAEHLLKSYREPAGDRLLRAKIGCLVVFAVGILLFLFLLFGLPYLIN